MIAAIIYDRIQAEMRCVADSMKDIVAIKCEEKCRVQACCTREVLKEIVAGADLEDFICVDICETNGTEIAINLRRRYPDTRILLIVDGSISPDQYILPSIMASSLILRPSNRDMIRNRLEGFMAPVLDALSGESDRLFRIETKEGITKIPYHQIYYYESSRKKVFIRLKTEEYSYYDTLDQLMGQLPEDFVRCHRSFIVNKNRVARYIASDNLIKLDDGTEIPVSRSYRPNIRNLVK